MSTTVMTKKNEIKELLARANAPSVDKEVDTGESDPLRLTVMGDRVVDFTHERAAHFLELETFKGERDVIDSWVQHLYDEFKRGRFLWDQVLIVTARLAATNLVYHINGQHTAWMRLHAPANVQARVRWIDYEVQDEENLRRLYGVFDRNKTRSQGHVMKALLSGTSSLEGVWATSITLLSTGLKLWLWEGQEQRKRHGPDELASLIQGRYLATFHRIARFWQANEGQRHIKRASVIAAMFETFETVPSKAIEFWEPVANGLGLSTKTDPRYRLREMLQNVSVDKLTSKHKAAVMPEDLYRICITAWNRWRKDEPAQLLRPTERRVKAV